MYLKNSKRRSLIRLTTSALLATVSIIFGSDSAHAQSIDYISSSSGYLLHQDISGTRAITTTWAGQAAIQGFTGYGQIRINGRCLTGSQQGQLRWLSCRNTASQRWGFEKSNGVLRNELGWCADVEGNRNGAGVPVNAWQCSNAINQRWKLHAKEISNPTPTTSRTGSGNQAIYFIDGTDSSFKQRNLLHQMSRWVKPRGGPAMIRYLAGIDTTRGDGVDDLYKLALSQIRSDVSNGIREFYVFGYSRGAFVALNLTGNLCGLGAPGEAIAEACSGMKAVVLIDPVRSTIRFWRDYQANQLTNNTIVIAKNETVWDLPVLIGHNTTNVGTKYFVQGKHSDMICYQGDQQSQNNTYLIEQQIVAFTSARDLSWARPDTRFQCLQGTSGAWPPCLAINGQVVGCSRNESRSNWEMNTW